MEVTKKHADAVRAYLSKIGHDISHVQALEVIARGQGLRSRHVKMELGASSSISVKADNHSCKQCGSDVKDLYCLDETCPFSDWPQSVDLTDLHNMSTEEIQQQYGVSKRVVDDAELDATAEFALSEKIKEEYLSSGCQSSDVDHAVSRLMAECASLFESGEQAWTFLMEERHEDLDVEYLLHMESDLFGNTFFRYIEPQERLEGLKRLATEALKRNDGIARSYHFSEMDVDLDKHSREYDEALEDRELVLYISENGQMEFYGEVIASVDDIS